MRPARLLILALLLAPLAWPAPRSNTARAEALEALAVLDLGAGERWRAVGSLVSSAAGARIVILEEEGSGRSKTARLHDSPFEGVKVVAILEREVLFDVRGTPARLRITRGTGSKLGSFAAPGPAAPEPEAAPPAAPVFARLRLTLEEVRDSALAIGRALRSGEIALGQNEGGIYGVKIIEAPPGGIAERLGLRPGDVVVAINGRPAADPDAAAGLLGDAEAAQSLPYAYRRGGSVGQGVVEIISEDGS